MPIMPRLVPPTTIYQSSYISAIDEYHHEGRWQSLSLTDLTHNFAAHVQSQLNQADPTKIPPDATPNIWLWLVDSDDFIGTITFRPSLTPELHQLGGHLGYQIRPSRRRLGYGTAALYVGLDYARAAGVTRVLLTCDEDNIGSRRIIEQGGGQLENIIIVPDHPAAVCRYWIALEGTAENIETPPSARL